MVVAAFNQNKALVGAFSVIVKLHKGSFLALFDMSARGMCLLSPSHYGDMSACPHAPPGLIVSRPPSSARSLTSSCHRTRGHNLEIVARGESILDIYISAANEIYSRILLHALTGLQRACSQVPLQIK